MTTITHNSLDTTPGFGRALFIQIAPPIDLVDKTPVRRPIQQIRLPGIFTQVIEPVEFTYADINRKMISNPNTGDIERAFNGNAIKQSITNLVFLNKGEVPFEPDLGSSIRRSLFEPNITVTRTIAETYIQEVIRNFEPRVENVRVQTVANEPGGVVAITILYTETIAQVQQTLTLTLDRVR